MTPRNKFAAYPGHPAPVSRRDFLARGIIASSAAMFLPSFMRGTAYAQNCPPLTVPDNYIPFLVFDMSGGAALPGNFLVGKEGGPEDLLASYSQLGWNPRAANAYDKRFGLPMGSTVSGLFRGITTTASAEAQAKLRLGSICHRAQDDTSVNQLSAIDLIMRAGYRAGSEIMQPLGTVNSLSGGNSRHGSENIEWRPLYVDQVDTVQESIGNLALKGYPPEAFQTLSEGIQSLGKSQWQFFDGTRDAEQIHNLGECLLGRLSMSNTTSNVDPRTDPIFQRLYGLRPNTPAFDSTAINAVIVNCVMRGISGPGVITLGECDYHIGSPTAGDQKDLTMGQHIGRAVQVAHELNKPLFFQLITDGGCYSDPNTRNWRSDAGEKCMTVIGFYDPRGAPAQVRQQLGHYTDGQGAALNSLVGASPTRAAQAAFVNYLQLSGRLRDYATLVPRPEYRENELDDLLIFAGG